MTDNAAMTLATDALGRIAAALEIAVRCGGIDGERHKAWVIDQMVRELTGDGYAAFIARVKAGAFGGGPREWDEGIPLGNREDL